MTDNSGWTIEKNLLVNQSTDLCSAHLTLLLLWKKWENPTVNITGLTMKWFSSKIGKEGKKPSFDSHRWVDELKWQRVTLPLSCARLETMTMRLGADFFSKSRRQLVRRKCPRWLTPNCISKPSSVVHLGHIMTPNKQQKHLYGEN